MAERRPLFREQALARRGRAEPIDGALRITAPHEWLFLLLLGLALLGVLAWAVLGTIERGFQEDCLFVVRDGVQAVSQEDSFAPRPPELRALTRLSPQQAHSVKPGMRARITSLGVDGVLHAEVRNVEIGDADGGGFWSGRALWSEGATHSVWLDLIDDAPAALQNGSTCGVRIVTGQRAPIRFIAAAGPR